MVLDWGFRCYNNIERNTTNKCIYAFSFLVGKHCEPWSINAKLSIPIIPIDIVTYAFTLSLDNLCRNSCIKTRQWMLAINYEVIFDIQRNYPTLWRYLLFHTLTFMYRVWLTDCISCLATSIYRHQDFWSEELTFPAILAFPCILSSLACSGRRLSKTVETTCK